jgi:hypothetical protein
MHLGSSIPNNINNQFLLLKEISMKILLTIACALLLTACFSEDQRGDQSKSTQETATMVSALTLSPVLDSDTI